MSLNNLPTTDRRAIQVNANDDQALKNINTIRATKTKRRTQTQRHENARERTENDPRSPRPRSTR
ncbi:hypothetical protein APL35_gp020 [Apis mellifera filamentous virus]|uniref:hypothetical protein n=1 Tax=Apis mellifera filamentous virus TaxID=1100043 RepID=UPI0006BC297C|nr:hypothetical protein APL35_gp020 [Apis mellifera filamentous virus]